MGELVVDVGVVLEGEAQGEAHDGSCGVEEELGEEGGVGRFEDGAVGQFVSTLA